MRYVRITSTIKRWQMTQAPKRKQRLSDAFGALKQRIYANSLIPFAAVWFDIENVSYDRSVGKWRIDYLCTVLTHADTIYSYRDAVYFIN